MRAADALEKAGGSAGVAGISVRGRDIKYIKAGDGEKGGIIVTGGIHAREHVTAKLVVMQAQKSYLGSVGVDERNKIDGHL